MQSRTAWCCDSLIIYDYLFKILDYVGTIKFIRYFPDMHFREVAGRMIASNHPCL